MIINRMSVRICPRIGFSILTMFAMTLASCKLFNSSAGSSHVQESDADASFKAGNEVPLTPVRDQGVSGFCWSYSTMAFLESLHKLRTGQDITLSPEALAFYHYVDYLKGSIANSPTADSIEALAVSLEENQDGSDFEDDVAKGSISLVKTYGVVPQDLFPVKFSATAALIDFVPRAPGSSAPSDSLGPDDLFHYEVADNLRYIMATKGLAFLQAMTEQDIMQNLMSSRYGVNFTAPPPQSFTYQGQTYTPQSFVTDFLKIDMNALVAKRVSTLSQYYTATNAINTDLTTFYSDANLNLHAGIAMPIGVAISDNHMTNGSFTYAVSNTDFLAQMAAKLQKYQQIVASYEARHPDAATNPPNSSNDPDAILYLHAKNFVTDYNPTGWANGGGGHAMVVVGPIKTSIQPGQPTDQLILKNSWGVSNYGTKDPDGMTSDGLYTIEQGYLTLVTQNDSITYISPSTPGVAPFLPSAGYSSSATASTANTTTAAASPWCDSNNVCYPYCTNGSNSGNQFGWQPELGGPNGGSCRVL